MAHFTKIEILKDRARMLAASRLFFSERNITEVDVPLLTQGASVDAHIDLIRAQHAREVRYLHSSPEYGMKRLLSEGIGDIYQLSHVFRAGEISDKHNPEFMLTEWYRIGLPFAKMIEETCDYIRLFLGGLPIEEVSYRETLKRFAGIDYVHADIDQLANCLVKHGVSFYPEAIEEGKDALLNLILGVVIEPNLGRDGLYVLAYYPSTQAALAQTKHRADEIVAKRFEVYHQGVELANGYHELADAAEQRRRLVEANKARLFLDKEPLPADELFLDALAKGLPDCCGVAVGFDRLMALRHAAHNIGEVIPFDWQSA